MPPKKEGGDGAVGGGAEGGGSVRGGAINPSIIQHVTVHQAGQLGSLSAFDEEAGTWEMYEETLQQYF